jgi:hypothetical protein
VIDLGAREKDLQHADLSRSTIIIIPRSRQTHLRITKCSIHVNDFPTAKKKDFQILEVSSQNLGTLSSSNKP